MRRSGWAALLASCLLVAASATAPTASVGAQEAGCRPELGSRTGARVTAQLLAEGPNGELVPEGPPAAEVVARSGGVLRLLIRPAEGSARPSGPGCPVRVNIGRLTTVARALDLTGFVVDGGRAYGQFRPEEERTLDFRIVPFEDWDAAVETLEVENLTILLPETAEFVLRLPAPTRPPPGSVCADVVYADGLPASGVVLGLSGPADGPTDRRPAQDDGRVCWDGFDELRYGELSLTEPADPALGLPRSRYVSREASYRLFVVKR